MLEPEEIKERLMELGEDIEKIAKEKNEAKGDMEAQETLCKLYKNIAYEKVPKVYPEKLTDKSRENRAGVIEITYRGKTTNVVDEQYLLSELQRKYWRSLGKWEALIETKWILMASLGFEKELIKHGV